MNPVRNFASGGREKKGEIMLEKQRISNGMKNRALKVMALFSVILIGCTGIRQNVSILDQSKPHNISQTQPRFYTEIFNIADPDSFEKSVASAYPIIPFSELIFTKHNSTFQAKYDVELWIFNDKNDSMIVYISNPGATSAITDYNKTRDPFTYTGMILRLKGQGSYQLNIRITDKATTRPPSQITIPIIMRNVHTGALNLSDPLFFNGIAEGKKFFNDILDSTINKTDIVPLNSQTLDSHCPINAVFEAYYAQPYQLLSYNNKQLVITYNLFSEKNEVVEGKQIFEIIPNVHRQTVGIQFSIPQNAKNGIYQLVLQASIQDKNTDIAELGSRSVAKAIRIYSPVPQTTVELNELINNLPYITDPPPRKVIKKLKKAKGREKEKLYRAFWKKHGGKHEMGQHYYRVAYANEHYTFTGDFRKMVCIRYGPPIPQNNARKEKEFLSLRTGDITYEVWTYSLPAADPDFYFGPLNVNFVTKTFIFVDEYGFGTYTFGGRYGRGRLEDHNDREFNEY
ncbi:hypothetical protein MYX07_00465 [Patescibacteria group bacterium AH-259-L07]|nr:hypothetical protein [Patescibacteria group bacterium AH-259-L07]